jgi:hypothetical protein
MTTATTTLAGFLLARIAEDESRAEMARGWQTGSRHEGQPLDWSLHMDRWSPDRALAECEAKRRIVEDWTSFSREGDYGRAMGLGHAVRALAAVYSDHPDYRDEWRL